MIFICKHTLTFLYKIHQLLLAFFPGIRAYVDHILKNNLDTMIQVSLYKLLNDIIGVKNSITSSERPRHAGTVPSKEN